MIIDRRIPCAHQGYQSLDQDTHPDQNTPCLICSGDILSTDGITHKCPFKTYETGRRFTRYRKGIDIRYITAGERFFEIQQRKKMLEAAEQEEKKMKVKIHQIETKSVLIVTNDCPLSIFRNHSYSTSDRKLDNCAKCRYFLGDKECGHQLYETRLIKHTSDTEPDDGSGALPSTDYIWQFECANCGSELSIFSGFSVMTSGDYGKCSNCNTEHRYIGDSNGIYFFAIKIDK